MTERLERESGVCGRRRGRRRGRARSVALAAVLGTLVGLPATLGTAAGPDQDGLVIVEIMTAPPQAILVGEAVSVSLAIIVLYAGVPAPLNAIVVWEPTRSDASEAELMWRARVRDYVADSLTDSALGAPRTAAIAASRAEAPDCGRMTSSAEVRDCLMRLDGSGEPELGGAAARIAPMRLAMRQELTHTFGLREWVVVFGDAVGVDDCEALATHGAALAADRVRNVAAICATSRCRQDCLASFTGSPRQVIAYDADFDSLLAAPRDHSGGVPRRAEAAEIRVAMGEGGRIETTSPSIGAERPSERAVLWRHGLVPVHGVTLSWTARALRPGRVDWLADFSLVVTDTLGNRIEEPLKSPRITGIALAPELLAGSVRLWLPWSVR